MVLSSREVDRKSQSCSFVEIKREIALAELFCFHVLRVRNGSLAGRFFKCNLARMRSDIFMSKVIFL